MAHKKIKSGENQHHRHQRYHPHVCVTYHKTSDKALRSICDARYICVIKEVVKDR